TVTVTVNPVNDAPVVVDDVAQIDEDSDITLDVLANDSDAENDVLTISSASADVGTVNIVNNMLAYSPQANYFGTVLINYSVEDGQGGLSSGQATLTVNSVNDLPVTMPESIIINEDQSITIDVLANDTDADGDALTLSSVSAENGSASISAGKIAFQPVANFYGTTTVNYTVSDGNGGSVSDVVDVTVLSVNDVPMALDDNASTDEDTPIYIDVLANDSDEDGDTLTISNASVSEGSIAIDQGQLLYTPVLNGGGSVTASYTISDANGASASANIVILIGNVNHLPVANLDTITTAEDTQVSIDVLANDTDIDGDELTLTSVSAPSGNAVINQGKVDFTPQSDFYGVVTLAYSIADVMGQTATGSVQVTVTPVNDSPVAVNDSASTSEDTSIQIDVITNDLDIDGDTLSLKSVSPSIGTASIEGNKVLFVPASNFFGTATIDYTIEDEAGLTASAQVTVDVGSTNDLPVALDDSATTNEDVTVMVDVLNNDSDSDGDTLTLVSATSNTEEATVSIVNNQLSIVPVQDFHGEIAIDYQLTDGNGGNASATLELTIVAVNDQPVSVADSVTTAEDTQITINVLANDSDVDGDT
ncbi:Ig-like domain-containing protein, partial [Catenovulum sediminis]